MTTPFQAHAQTSPLTEDQDGDGDKLIEEDDIAADCNFDHTIGGDMDAEFESTFGETPPPTLSEEGCNFAMHYLSGQCEEQTAKGVNVTGVCDATLKDYLSATDVDDTR